MSNLFGSGFYDNYEAKYSVSDYLDDSIVGFQRSVTNALSGNDVKQQHFDNAVDRGDPNIVEHFSKGKSNAQRSICGR